MQRGLGAGCEDLRAAVGKSATNKSFLIDDVSRDRARTSKLCAYAPQIGVHGTLIELALELRPKGNTVMILTS